MDNICFCLMLLIPMVNADVDSDDFEAVDRFKRFYYNPLRYGYYPMVSSGIPPINAYKKYPAYQRNQQAGKAKAYDLFDD